MTEGSRGLLASSPRKHVHGRRRNLRAEAQGSWSASNSSDAYESAVFCGGVRNQEWRLQADKLENWDERKLPGDFAVLRVRPADGAETKDGVHLPGSPAWLACERLSNGDRKFYLVNLPASASRKSVVAAIKARWACEQGHQQMKEELGLDHFEGRSWFGLHHHAVLTMIAFAFLQHLRLTENKSAA